MSFIPHPAVVSHPFLKMNGNATQRRKKKKKTKEIRMWVDIHWEGLNNHEFHLTAEEKT
jgi:hypothetical protein